MNFSQFLTLIEGVVADGDHKMVIDNDRNEDELAEFIKEKCGAFLKNSHRPTIYRGSRSEQNRSYILSPSRTNRVSANTNNAYTVIFSETLGGDYPTRNKSIICTTSKKTAEAYGHVNVLFPCDNSKIGDTCHDDIWNVRYDGEHTIKEFADAIEHNAHIDIDNITNIHQVVSIILYSYFSDHSKEFYSLFDGLDEIEYDEDGGNDEEYEDIILKNIKEVFDPENLGFESYKPSTLQHSTDDELWIGGDIISVPLSVYEKIKDKL